DTYCTGDPQAARQRRSGARSTARTSIGGSRANVYSFRRLQKQLGGLLAPPVIGAHRVRAPPPKLRLAAAGSGSLHDDRVDVGIGTLFPGETPRDELGHELGEGIAAPEGLDPGSDLAWPRQRHLCLGQ